MAPCGDGGRGSPEDSECVEKFPGTQGHKAKGSTGISNRHASLVEKILRRWIAIPSLMHRNHQSVCLPSTSSESVVRITSGDFDRGHASDTHSQQLRFQALAWLLLFPFGFS